MNLIITINLDNAAFEDQVAIRREVRTILRKLIDNSLFLIGFWQYGKPLKDSNGNTVGTVEVTE